MQMMHAGTIGKSLGHHPNAKRRPCMCACSLLEGFAEAVLLALPESLHPELRKLDVFSRLEGLILGLGNLMILYEVSGKGERGEGEGGEKC